MVELKRYFRKGVVEAGCDEAGRGCLAGPVVAAAVVLEDEIPGLNDSKKLTQAQREALRPVVEAKALSWSVAFLSPAAIDELNILRASFQAMHQAIQDLSVRPELLLIDGNRFDPFPEVPHECIVKGDGKFLSIAAASILAKTHRDAYMKELHGEFPSYQWDRNKGYPTPSHRRAIREYGITPYHRKSFSLTGTQLKMGL